MFPSRRGFLGSVMGIIAGKEFIIDKVQEKPTTKLEVAKRKIKIFEVSPRTLNTYKMFAVEKSNQIPIYFPPIIEVRIDYTDLIAIFKAGNMVARQSMFFDKLGLLDPDGGSIGLVKMNSDIMMVSGDVLEATFKVVIEG